MGIGGILLINEIGVNVQYRHCGSKNVHRKNISAIIFSLPLIQEGQLSVSGETMYTILVYRSED